MAYRNDWIRLIRQYASRYHVDPQAALSVASSEGLSGGVGDQGTSFGPFQLHRGGALPAGRDRAWAESPAGIEYALRQIGGVAGGLHGRAAVENIVRRFEKPANPGGEIGRALAALGSFGGPGPVSAPQALHAPPVSAGMPANGGLDPAKLQLLTGLLQKQGGLGHLPPEALSAALSQRLAPQASRPSAGTSPAAPEASSGRDAPARGSLAEAFYDPLGQWDNGRFSTHGIGGHSDHVHLSVTDPGAMLAAIQEANRLGLHAGENPYLDHVHPVHVKGSYHYRTFPGKFGGRSLGEGLDVSGDAAKMGAYFKWALAHLR